MPPTPILTAEIPDDMAGLRLDQALAGLFPDFSRSRLTAWIRDGKVRVDARACRPRDRVIGGEHIELVAEIEAVGDGCEPESIRLDIVYEDRDLLVVNKPAGLVVHPGAGNRSGTLQNALLHHDPALAKLPRAGIVHRLDKDTSGLLVVARTPAAHHALVKQMQAREIEREYEAVVYGVMTGGGTVEADIGRHPTERTRMAVRPGGRVAVTHYRVVERYKAHTRIRVQLETGRTHQIRVHMAHIHHPILGDPVYGGRARVPGGDPRLREAIQGFKRQALHAARLALSHPVTGVALSWEAPLPDDLRALLVVLADHAVA
jgi:23S rRNA pseudouridine1911/1915/1917 synthase